VKFSIQTLVAITASLAIALTCMRAPKVGVGLMLFVLPITMMLIGLTSPQSGNQLDPSKRWYLFVLAKTWIFTLVWIVSVGCLIAISPKLEDRLQRALRGDLRKHQIRVSFDGDEALWDELNGRRFTLYDSAGFVGEVRGVYYGELYQGGKKSHCEIHFIVSTNREDRDSMSVPRNAIELREDGSVFLKH
jgi:hypothetical protein